MKRHHIKSKTRPYHRVLRSFRDVLKSRGFYLIFYNSRGVGGSSGWPSFSGLQEGQDLQEIVQWGLDYLTDVRHVLLLVKHASLLSEPPVTHNLPGIFLWIINSCPATDITRPYQDFTHSSLLPTGQASTPHIFQLSITQ